MSLHIIIESSTLDGVYDLIQGLKEQYAHVGATLPVEAPGGIFLSSVHLSNDRTIVEVRNVDHL